MVVVGCFEGSNSEDSGLQITVWGVGGSQLKSNPNLGIGSCSSDWILTDPRVYLLPSCCPQYWAFEPWVMAQQVLRDGVSGVFCYITFFTGNTPFDPLNNFICVCSHTCRGVMYDKV